MIEHCQQGKGVAADMEVMFDMSKKEQAKRSQKIDFTFTPFWLGVDVA